MRCDGRLILPVPESVVVRVFIARRVRSHRCAQQGKKTEGSRGDGRKMRWQLRSAKPATGATAGGLCESLVSDQNDVPFWDCHAIGKAVLKVVRWQSSWPASSSIVSAASHCLMSSSSDMILFANLAMGGYKEAKLPIRAEVIRSRSAGNEEVEINGIKILRGQRQCVVVQLHLCLHCLPDYLSQHPPTGR